MPINISKSTKIKLLDLLSELGSHTVYPSEYIINQLSQIDFPAKHGETRHSLIIETVSLSEIEPEFGDKGISTLQLLRAIIQECGLEEEVTSTMNGRGFYYRDLLQKLASQWEISKNYL